MPETRCVKVYKDGELMGEEDCHEVSDEDLYQEQLEHEFNEVHVAAIKALKHFDKLTREQKDTILKNLVKWALWKDGWLKSGVL